MELYSGEQVPEIAYEETVETTIEIIDDDGKYKVWNSYFDRSSRYEGAQSCWWEKVVSFMILWAELKL